ncbi:MAG TPA: hypothetical protein VFX30_03400 [bacterium]|nr:hypothetical protein [bacterium]
MIRKPIRLLSYVAALLLTALASGCIETGESRSFYITPDGQVDVVIYQDNVHVADADKPQDLQDWFKKLKSRQSDEVKKFKETGAKDIRVTIIRKTPPYAAVTGATYATVKDFGRLFDLNREGAEGTLTFEQQGATRRLVFQAKDTGKQSPPKKANADDPSNYAPIWKFIPVGGHITQADGFIVSEDKRSCLLNLPKLDRMKKTPEGYLFSIAWTVD